MSKAVSYQDIGPELSRYDIDGDGGPGNKHIASAFRIDPGSSALKTARSPRNNRLLRSRLWFFCGRPIYQAWMSSGLSESCPKNGDVPKSPLLLNWQRWCRRQAQ
jgi:hypothetical protein